MPVVPPNPPTIVVVTQTSTEVVVSLQPNPITGDFPVASLQLLRGTSALGPFILITTQPISSITVLNNLVDPSPVVGVQEFYVATATDTQGNVSALSAAWPFTAMNVSAPGSSRFSAAAFGPYAILGTDVFIDPRTGEAVLAPNGDLQIVTGLACLAQDLRIRFLTEFGELVMHPDFGLGKSGIIGSGQADPQTQAQILRVRVTNALLAEPRVKEVQSVAVYQNGSDGWSVEITLVAIGSEDPAHLNLTFPFY